MKSILSQSLLDRIVWAQKAAVRPAELQHISVEELRQLGLLLDCVGVLLEELDELRAAAEAQ